MDFWVYFLLVFVAGFIDAIAGGGGLITVPTIALIVGPGPLAIGTNKIVGFTAAFTAFVVYARNGQFHLQRGIIFATAVFAGSFGGSQVGTHIPSEYFKWMMLAVCPFILIMVLKKESLLSANRIRPIAAADAVLAQDARNFWVVIGAGLACGFYDGILGPGGGTIMLLCLLVFAQMPILLAIGISKFANLLSALAALGGYALHDQVAWQIGFKLAVFAGAGAFLGSKLNTKRSAVLVRPMLALVVIMLFIKLAYDA